jgi:hypothetical protein
MRLSIPLLGYQFSMGSRDQRPPGSFLPRGKNLGTRLIPTIEEVLPDLTNAKVFSKVDCRSGYWQIKLDHESSMLTTFNTPFGRYRWTRMPFGISPAGEIFQRRLDQAIEGLDGVKIVADDILAIGNGATTAEAVKDHDTKLDALLSRCRERRSR